MKVQFLIALALVAIHQVNAQKSFADFKPKASDPVYAFDPIGNISTSDNYAIVPDRHLSDSCLSSFKTALKEKTPFEISYIGNQKVLDRSNQEYFMKLMERVEKTNPDLLLEVSYGKYIQDLISGYEGRYFCFIFYSGLESVGQKAKTNAGDADHAGALYFPLATEKSFLHTYLLIVDKESGKVAYFNHNKITGSPVKKSTVENQVRELLTYHQQ